MRERTKRLRGDTRGAVLVEFLVAFMPLMITFFSFTQVAQIATARLVVKHAAVVGARAAAVISNGNHNTPDQDQGTNEEAIMQGVLTAMGPWVQTMDGVHIDIDDRSSCDDQYGMVSVTVTAQYHCSVPFGNLIVCGGTGLQHRIVHKMGFPHQGARYKDLGGASCQ